jgi:hypothetical protein
VGPAAVTVGSFIPATARRVQLPVPGSSAWAPQSLRRYLDTAGLHAVALPPGVGDDDDSDSDASGGGDVAVAVAVNGARAATAAARSVSVGGERNWGSAAVPVTRDVRSVSLHRADSPVPGGLHASDARDAGAAAVPLRIATARSTTPMLLASKLTTAPFDDSLEVAQSLRLMEMDRMRANLGDVP